MRVLFWGTPEFASGALHALLYAVLQGADEQEGELVVDGQGRGHRPLVGRGGASGLPCDVDADRADRRGIADAGARRLRG